MILELDPDNIIGNWCQRCNEWEEIVEFVYSNIAGKELLVCISCKDAIEEENRGVIK